MSRAVLKLTLCLGVIYGSACDVLELASRTLEQGHIELAARHEKVIATRRQHAHMNSRGDSCIKTWPLAFRENLVASEMGIKSKMEYSILDFMFVCMTKPTYANKTYSLLKILKSARISCGITQEQLSEKISRSQSFVTKYENNERSLKIVEFLEICEALNISPSKIIEEVVNADILRNT